MNRSNALIISVLTLLIYLFLTYYFIELTFISSLVFSSFISLIILNILYPISNSVTDDNDFSLFVYLLYQLIIVGILFLYVTLYSLTDTRIN